MAGEDADDLRALLARVRAGDESALGELLRRCEPQLRTAARVLLGPMLRPHLDSLDVVQSVHRTLLPGLQAGRYDLSEPGQLVALALTVVRRKVADGWRKARRTAPPGTAPAVGTDDPVDESAPDPAELAGQRDAAERLLTLADGPDRELLRLRLEGLDTPEIARRLGADPHVLRARLSRLRKRLREAGAEDWI
jgi:RNA polymerase sigma-70 factor (ECF subfamily)